VGLGGPPPVRELSLLCRLIKREQSHWGRPPMTLKYGTFCKKINYRLNRPKIGSVRVSIILINSLRNTFCYTLPSGLLEQYAFKEVMGQ
jgi:hypothetical protein